MGVYIGRYYLIYQRLRRKRGWYRPSTIDAASREDVIEVCLYVHSSASCRMQSSEVQCLVYSRNLAVIFTGSAFSKGGN